MHAYDRPNANNPQTHTIVNRGTEPMFEALYSLYNIYGVEFNETV